MGIFDLGPFRRTVDAQRKVLEKSMTLAKGADTIAFDRLALENMEKELAQGEKALKPYTNPVPGSSNDPGFRFKIFHQTHAVHLLMPGARDPSGYDRKVKEYEDLARQLKDEVNKAYRFLHDNEKRREIWVMRRNEPTKRVIEAIAKALDETRKRHEPDFDDGVTSPSQDFLRVPAREALHRMLIEERPDLLLALRAATRLPSDFETFVLEEKERPTWQTVFEVAVGFIPIVGNIVAAYEVWRGEDLFGNELSDAERAIIGASILLPAAGRLVKAGKSMYTAERMARLYGPDARWAETLARAERLSADAAGMGRLRAAEQAAARNQKVTKTAAEKLQDVFKTIGFDKTGRAVTPTVIEARVVRAFEEVVAKHPKLLELDALAVQRVLAKGAEVNAVKGQLLEELLESHITQLLRDPLGRQALGLGRVKGTLYFIPGHLIRDELALQLTDGMIVRFVKDRLQVVAVFEAKSGAASAQGLVRKSRDISKATAAERRRVAEESLAELQERARISGDPAPRTTVEQLEKQIVNSELGGQLRSDIERLAETKVWVNGRELPVELQSGPLSTKWFGILPSDVDGAALVQSLRNQAKDPRRIINVEMLGLDITASELVKAAQSLIQKAKDLGL